MDVRDAYKFARYQGEGDQAAAEFVEWFVKQPASLVILSEAYKQWRGECEMFSLLEQEITDG
jgi:hypothetical protein